MHEDKPHAPDHLWLTALKSQCKTPESIQNRYENRRNREPLLSFQLRWLRRRQQQRLAQPKLSSLHRLRCAGAP